MLFTLSAERLTGWDYLVAGLIVLFIEFIIKKIFSDKKYEPVWKFGCIILGAVFYLILSIIQKGVWYTSMIHGIFVGLTAMGSYDAILAAMLNSGKKSIEDANKAVEEAIKKDK